MNILITGATGFIGKHLCVALTQQGHHVMALMRNPDKLRSLREFVQGSGGQPERITVMQGDLEKPGLGLSSALEGIDCIVHLAARFAWNLAPDEARRTNVTGSLHVAELAKQLDCRLIFITGFMLANETHLAHLGINLSQPDQTRWQDVYRRTGAYEASKLESAFALRHYTQEHGMDAVEIQPATVAGHNTTGEIDPTQPLFSLIDNVFHGRMALIPGSPAHWLPLIPVDTLALVIAAACGVEQPPLRLLVLDNKTPNLQGLLRTLTMTMGMKAPRWHLPIPVMQWLLKLPGLARVLNVYPEALDFIQSQSYNTLDFQRFLASMRIPEPAFSEYIQTTAQYYRSLAPE
ncbi:SDR family oxidoreductase [Marinobacter sp. SS5-14b]|uniref:SDR family oxidoreductase n=1 Tax=Marinobacter sp. SS5-14b TaxID=3050456 RepID=UPI0026E04EAC|nr:SDR family oxidoreductase [Marinobacter sp. SS5-14b]